MEWHTRMLQSLQTLSSASSNVLSWLANQWQRPIHPNATDWKDQHIRILSTEDLEFQQCTHHKLHAQKHVFPNGLLACLTPFDQNAGWEVQTPWCFATQQPPKLAHSCWVSSLHAAWQSSDLTCSKSIRNILLCFLVSLYVCLKCVVCVCIHVLEFGAYVLVEAWCWHQESFSTSLHLTYYTEAGSLSWTRNLLVWLVYLISRLWGFSVPASHLLWSSQEGYRLCGCCMKIRLSGLHVEQF